MEAELVSKYGLLLAPEFLDEDLCQRILQETRINPSGPATVYGSSESGAVDERVRKASRMTAAQKTVGLVKKRLIEFKENVERHFCLQLLAVEEPQFLRYSAGDFFVAHQDGNTGMIRLKTEADRKVSIVIFLNSQSQEATHNTYSGGSLKFSDYRAELSLREFSVRAETGMLVAFRAELTHEVTPVIAGQRYSIVSWYK